MSPEKIIRQFGLWDSPITPASLARSSGFSDVAWDEQGSLVWREARPDRGVLVVQPPDGQASRLLNSEFSVRARLGYGGGDFAVKDGMAYFVEAESGRIYRQSLFSGKARSVTPAFGRFAAPAISPDGRWLLFVHSYEGEDTLGITSAAGETWPHKLVVGNDFYMQPVWHPDGRRIAWIDWNQPNMPWDGTFLRLGMLNATAHGPASLEDVETIAGDETTSIFQPQFSPDGRYLAYVSDQTGWWQIYLYGLDAQPGEHRQLTFTSAEHGLPAWVQGQRTYAFSPDSQRLYFLRNQSGFVTLWQLELQSGAEARLPLDETYTDLEQIRVNPVDGRIAMIASGGRQPPQMITYTPPDRIHIWQRATSEELPASDYSSPQAIEWQGLDGGNVYGIFYPPHNGVFEGKGKPPLIVLVHGGPTSQRLAAFDSQAQFFASRGYAVLLVNYRGSTGYGRAYRNALRGCWGLYDVQDSVSGARALVEQGQVDGERLVILGGSAGGFTVLKALEDYPGFFKVGVCLYGVSNQFTFAAETHKFEARYMDMLLGALPEACGLYRERSPINFLDRIKDPVAVFQGEIDQVVPRRQSDEVVEALRRRGVPHIYHVYPGEGHGFRKAETIEHYYTAVEKFLREYVIFT